MEHLDVRHIFSICTRRDGEIRTNQKKKRRKECVKCQFRCDESNEYKFTFLFNLYLNKLSIESKYAYERESNRIYMGQ